MNPSPLPPPEPPKSNLPMLYYGLVVVGTVTIVLALYNLLIIKWCTEYSDRRRMVDFQRPSLTPIFHKPKKAVVPSFKYQKNEADDSECVVCLSVFEEGEEIKQLPLCNHCFHAPCIDMWLYSHVDCPLCRSPVEPPALCSGSVIEQSENSREGLMDPGELV
ncbi:unnamed protein product [Fraxinus pennsylvanica]|uniref:RING-type domain-containing protein n=1 Tax=Fraxinus pennsylvanica TaxID=56036 RepID=A0AAD1YXC6_9LAMI|nr:unnamed protein product [Fraxinus pennsylvanica]